MPTETAEVPPDKKEATRAGMKAAKTDSATQEAHNQADPLVKQQSGPLYHLKPNCSSLRQNDWKKLRRWQRRKDHERWIRAFIVEAHDRTLFVTVTFNRFVSARQAKEAARRFLRKRLAAVVESYVRVIERQRNGRSHIHWLFRLISSASVGGWKAI